MSRDPEPLDAPFYNIWQRVFTVLLAGFASMGTSGNAPLCTLMRAFRRSKTKGNSKCLEGS